MTGFIKAVALGTALVWSANAHAEEGNAGYGKMVFPGLKKAQDRADVIAYLKTQTGK